MAQSNQCPAHSMQVSRFVKNGRLDLRKAFNEVQRRASKIGCANFQCSFEGFKALAVEGKRLTEIGVREAISLWKGPDFIVEGLGDYSHITHIEMKNPVGSAIEIASFGETNLVSQGEKIGSKFSKQQVKWSDRNFVEKLPHYNQSESFPQLCRKSRLSKIL